MEEKRPLDLIITFLDDPDDIQLVKDLWKSKQPNPSAVNAEDIPIIKIKWDYRNKCFCFSEQDQALLSRLNEQSKITIYGHGYNNEFISCQRGIYDFERSKLAGKLMTVAQMSDLIKKNLPFKLLAPIADSRLTVVLHICNAASAKSEVESLNSFAGRLHRGIGCEPQGIKTTLYAHQENFYIIIDDTNNTAVHGSSQTISITDTAQMKHQALSNEQTSSEVIFLFNQNNDQIVVMAKGNEDIATYNQQKICKKYIIDKLNEISSLMSDPRIIQAFINEVIPQCTCLNHIIIKLPELLELVQRADSQKSISSSFISFFSTKNPQSELANLIACCDKMSMNFRNIPFDVNTVSIYLSVAHKTQPFTIGMLIEQLKRTNYPGFFRLQDLYNADPLDMYSLVAKVQGEDCYQSIIKLSVPKEYLDQLIYKREGRNHFLITEPSEGLQAVLLNSHLEVLSSEKVKYQPSPNPQKS